ncbi:TFIIB-type zinc ribbon-containing protein [Nonomuraea wenchangensis]|uniref:TFIIB-type zinc ribbon-containing protein n=1 Tax=Nonomuraea wenchangensis TaxID=568860 RepID=UPI00116081CF|nr:TFIIB-type zinc ribbon-containing protein [Nonomuraea wenchangensis]
MSDRVCVGPCNRQARAVWQVFLGEREAHADAVDRWLASGGEGEPPPEPAVPVVEWRAGEPLHCGRCRATGRRALLVVDELAASLAARPGEVKAQSRWSRVKGTRPHGSLSGEADLVHTVTGEVLRLRREVARRLELADQPPAGRSGMARSRSVSWLVDKLDAALALDGLTVVSSVEDDERTVELGPVEWALAWENKLRRLVDDAPGHTLARCPGCGERHLEWAPRAGYYVCGGCGRHVSEAEALELVTEEASA